MWAMKLVTAWLLLVLPATGLVKGLVPHPGAWRRGGPAAGLEPTGRGAAGPGTGLLSEPPRGTSIVAFPGGVTSSSSSVTRDACIASRHATPRLASLHPSVSVTTTTSPARHACLPTIAGGLFFWWQAGFIAALQEDGVLRGSEALVGASAGSLSAVLTACEVDMADALDLALELSNRYRIWDRPLGLMGLWGTIVEEWF